MFTHLQSLVSLLAKETTQVTEEKSSASDFDGIKSIVDDCLADLSDKLGKGGALSDLMKSTGADAMDTHKDDDGLTVQAALAKCVADFKKKVEGLMDEVELMVASGSTQVEEGVATSKQPLNEGKDYADSGEFTDELYTVGDHLSKVKQAVKQPRWTNWMQVTDHNFDTSCVALNKDFTTKLLELDKAFQALEDDLHSAG